MFHHHFRQMEIFSDEHYAKIFIILLDIATMKGLDLDVKNEYSFVALLNHFEKVENERHIQLK